MDDFDLENALAEMQECSFDLDEDSPKCVPDLQWGELDLNFQDHLLDFSSFDPTVSQLVVAQEEFNRFGGVNAYSNLTKEVKKEEHLQRTGITSSGCFTMPNPQGLQSGFSGEIKTLGLDIQTGVQNSQQPVVFGGTINSCNHASDHKLNFLADNLSPSLMDPLPSLDFGQSHNQENLPFPLSGVRPTGVKTATLSDSNSCSGKLAWIKQSSRRAGGTSGLSEKCLEELKEVDPKRAKRIVSNRESAARSKERKLKHIHNLEQESKAQQSRSQMLHEHLEQCLKINMGLQQENTQMRQHVQTAIEKLQKSTALKQSLQQQMHISKPDFPMQNNPATQSSRGWPIRKPSPNYSVPCDIWTNFPGKQQVMNPSMNCTAVAQSSTQDQYAFQNCMSGQSIGTPEPFKSPDLCGSPDFPIPFMEIHDDELSFGFCDDNWSTFDTSNLGLT